jgi:hypothetical protein
MNFTTNLCRTVRKALDKLNPVSRRDIWIFIIHSHPNGLVRLRKNVMVIWSPSVSTEILLIFLSGASMETQ